MNALEIAQEFEEYLKEIEELPWGNHQILCDQAATMLRQQQAEIKALKKEAALQRLSDFTQEADNEPVAWMPIQSKHTRIQETKPDDEQNWIPLYLHPVELTDEEIIKVYEDMLGVASAKGSAIDFARAILRKAQEK